MRADWMMPKVSSVDYGAWLADDFTKWSDGWSWSWKVRAYVQVRYVSDDIEE